MIGFAMRAAMGGDALGPCAMICGPLIAVIALCGIWKFCCRCRMRDCGCIKRCLRMTGTDQFDDFDMMILVHTAKFTSSSKTATFVRVKAGDQVVETDTSSEGLFHQTVNLLVEQGASAVDFDLCDGRKRVLATLKLDVMKDILVLEDGQQSLTTVKEKVFTMKQKQKSIINPKITLTFTPERMGDEEKALLSGINASAETEWMLTQHINKMGQDDKKSGKKAEKIEELSEVELLAKGCAGPVEKFGKMGAKHPLYAAVIGPPRKKRFGLHTWKSEKEFQDQKPYIDEVDLLKITSIAADPTRAEVFMVNYIDEHKQRASLKFNRVDRSRDVWVEMLQLLVMKVHAEHKERKKDKKGK